MAKNLESIMELIPLSLFALRADFARSPFAQFAYHTNPMTCARAPARTCAETLGTPRAKGFNKKLTLRQRVLKTLVIGGVTACVVSAHGADIYKVAGRDGKMDQILIKGEIGINDAKTFTQIALTTEKAVVVLDSPGGLLMPAIEIGKAIKLKGFATAAFDSECTSACALAWIAGQPRMISKGAAVGFHAAYTEDHGGKPVSSALANALVGSYLNNLGMNESVVAFVTSAGPDQIHWINKKEAAQMDLKVLKFEYKLGALLDFSLALEKRFGPNPSLTEAAKLYRLSADEGYAGALNNLGDMYEQGIGVSADDKFAIYLYTRAAERGEPTAYLSLSTFLSKGSSDEAILIEAVKFGLLAVSNLPDGKNKDYAMRSLQSLTKQVSKEGYARAVELAHAWQPLYQEEHLMGDTPEK